MPGARQRDQLDLDVIFWLGLTSPAVGNVHAERLETRYNRTAPSGVSLTTVGTFLAEHPPNMNVDRHPLQLALRPLGALHDGVKALSRGLNTEFFNQ